jgi:NTE family protein
LAHDRGEIFSRMLAARRVGLVDLVASGIGSSAAIDAEKFCEQFLPDVVPDEFEKLPIPLTVVASDLYRRTGVVLATGSLKRAVGASIALPGVVQPVVIEDRVLVDGGATNPLPFDLLRDKDCLTVAVDVSGEPTTDRRDLPSAWECVYATVLVMAHTIISEKLKHGGPDLLIRPKVGLFRTLDFPQASAILRASEPIKVEVKEKLTPLLEA